MSCLSSSRLIALIWFVGFAYVATRLPDAELTALSVVLTKLGKSDWKPLEVDPCTNQSPWWNQTSRGGSGVYCNCTTQITTCHVTRIILKEMNLTGSLPQELVGLSFLEEIDLTRNYLNGTIPPQWGSMQSLKIISLLGNRLDGQIPKELANITALVDLVLEANKFNGSIPSEFGNLTNIQRLLLSSNYLTGPIPPTLAKLTTLTQFRISDNNFTGTIPEFIQNWINVERIEIQASGLTGPIPANLTSLTNLRDLRISDLNGSVSKFPNLSVSKTWDNLILRSCNIEGEIPRSIAGMDFDDNLDLSFNKFTGPIPPGVGDLRAGRIYLTGNSLNGTVPNDMKNKEIDLSYNNITDESSSPNCGNGRPNLFAHKKGNNTSGTFYCINRSCGSNDNYSFKVNCGSNRKVGDYEADYPGESKFYNSSSNWGFSSTGHFLNREEGNGYGTFTWPSDSGSDLYHNARLSPLSLTYFGYCLRNGNYTVELYFKEIMFTDEATFGSLGRRFFDIYIQGKLEKKDFSIEIAAGGVNKPHTEKFTAEVVDHTMEIRFYWAGKGTTALPQRSVYGPLISAISVVHSDYRPSKGISTGAIVGIVMAVVLGVILILGILWWKGCLGHKDSLHHDLRGLDLHTGSFTLRQIRAATNNFDPSNKIGEGGFGPVHKGVLLDGTIIAVKQLSSKSKQGNREFINEIGMISALQHPHLVKLYGCCIEGNQLLLVYEYCENNSLARALFGPEEYRLHLDWATRHNICIGIARGLAYLHEESRLKIVHRDIKATNVLLDGNLVPKISDFGLAKLDEEDNTHISTRIAGTFGYMAPEYAMRGYLTDKADVYSFGVVVLEVVSGRSNSSIRPKEANFNLLDWANSLKSKGNLLDLVDPRLEMNYKKEEVSRAINVALLCTNAEAVERPSMSAVVSILEGRVSVQNLVSEWKTKPEEMEMEMEKRGPDDGNSIFVDAPWTGSSTSAPDLYPLALDTSYWEKRGL